MLHIVVPSAALRRRLRPTLGGMSASGREKGGQALRCVGSRSAHHRRAGEHPFSGHGEYGITTHLLLTATGLPLSLLSWHILPNGSILCVVVAGVIGTVQWCSVAEANARWEHCRRSRPPARAHILSPRARLRALWAIALGTPLIAVYALLSAVTYVWFNASGHWPAERASLWANSAFALFCVFGVIAVVAIVLLVRHYNGLSRHPDQQEEHDQ